MSNKEFDPYDFSKKIIDGVPMYYKNFPSSPAIHIRVCFNVGSLNDDEKSAGVSHFLEHMIFDGAPSLPTKKDIKEWSKIHALNSWNAWTWYTNTNYHLKCLPAEIDNVLAGMKDMIFHPLLRTEDVEHERKVITQEAWGRYKNEKYLAYRKEMWKNTYHGTAQVNTASPLGWPDTIAQISQADIAKWHKANYGKGNFFMVVAGAIEEKHLEKIEKFLEGIPKAKPSKLDFGNLSKPKKTSVTKLSDKIGDPREQAEVSFERTMPAKSAPGEEIELMAGALLQDILFERLRTEKALCYGVSAGSHIQRNLHEWGVNIKVKEENVKTVKVEYQKALSDIFTGKEKKRFDTLKKVRIDRLKSMEEITEDTTDEVLDSIWKYGKIVPKSLMLKEREKVTYSDVVKCLKEAFKKDWVVTEVILPSKK